MYSQLYENKVFNYEIIGIRLKEIMKDKHIKQEELAKKSGVSRVAINRIINGQTHNPPIDTLLRICNVLDCTLDSLLGVYNQRNYDNHKIAEETGLTEESIDELKRIHEQGGFLSTAYEQEHRVPEHIFQNNLERIICNPSLLVPISDYINPNVVKMTDDDEGLRINIGAKVFIGIGEHKEELSESIIRNTIHSEIKKELDKIISEENKKRSKKNKGNE